MADYIQITFDRVEPEQQGLLVAILSEALYEGFEETGHQLVAYIIKENFDEFILNEISFKYQLKFTRKLIKNQNWNSLWESNFDPVIIEDFAGIRAIFHAPLKNVRFEIVITPKMSFGTGHHATTSMMIRQMREIEFKDKIVFDFGTGTGVLAILAEKLGAKQVFAVDNDSWSISNAKENIDNNNCTKIVLKEEESVAGNNKYDIIMANINRNVILEHLPDIVKNLSKNGILLLSGFIEQDEKNILRSTTVYKLDLVKKMKENNWMCLMFSH